MTKLRQEIKKNYLNDYKSYPATVFTEESINDAPVWIGLIINNDVVLDVKWHAKGIDEATESLLITISQELIGLTQVELAEKLASFQENELTSALLKIFKK
jgi:hypothetical protein